MGDGTRARVLTLANQKGGSGKSLAANVISKILAERGRSVLVVDCDEQSGNLTGDMGVERDATGGTAEAISRVLSGAEPDVASLAQRAYDAPSGGLVDVLAGTDGLASLAVELSKPGTIGRERVLGRAIEASLPAYDWVVVDTAGDFSVLSLSALVATDDVLVPCRPTSSSVQGASTICHLAEQVRDNYNPRLRLAGLFLNDINPRTRVHRDVSAMVAKVCEAQGVPLMATSLRHSTKADEIASYAAAPSEVMGGTVAHGLVRDSYALVDEYLAGVVA